MNKRKAKKARKKVMFPIADEINLLTLNQEEYEKAITDYRNFAYKYCRYFHYKDKNKKLCFYAFPVGETTRKGLEELAKTARKCRSVQVINQPLPNFNKSKNSDLSKYEG